MRVQILSERRNMLDGQIRYDAFGEHQSVSRTRIYCRKQRAPGGHVGKIELHPLKLTSRPLARQAAVFEFDEVRVVHFDPPERAWQCALPHQKCF
jgi:hypothetical protein